MVDRDAGTMSLTVTRATLNTDTPIVGVELAPYIVTRKSDGTSTTEDIGRENPHEGSCVRYRWFRSGKKTRMSVCSVHPAEQATLLNVATRTYHCDSECFKFAWREWNRNRIANGEPFPTKAERAQSKDDLEGWKAAKAERAVDVARLEKKAAKMETTRLKAALQTATKEAERLRASLSESHRETAALQQPIEGIGMGLEELMEKGDKGVLVRKLLRVSGLSATGAAKAPARG